MFPAIENASIADPTDPDVARAMARHAEWERSLAAQYAALPVPRASYDLWCVLAPRSERVHWVATAAEVVAMLTPTWPVLEERWAAVSTVCGRGGPFESPGGTIADRQRCRKCNATEGAWAAYGHEAVG